MNGRLYDPVLHRFLQPDNYVQDPYNTQNYNRYAYVLNNPLKYTDPSGEEITLLASIAIGAAISAGTYVLTQPNVNAITLKGFLKSVATGAITAAVTFGVGEWVSGIDNLFLRTGVQAISHGVVQGGFSHLQGGTFLSGFASGSLSSIASTMWSGGQHGSKFIKGFGSSAGEAGAVFFATMTGGAGAALTGGNFWAGAASGLMVSLLNHAAHAVQENNKIKLTLEKLKKIYDSYPKNNGDDYISAEQLYEMVGGPLGKHYDNIMTNNDPNDDAYWYNTCSTRLSVALNKAGFLIPKNAKGAWKGANGKFYIVNSNDMFLHLKNTFQLEGSYSQGKEFINGITAHSKYGKRIDHVDLFYKGETKNSNYYFWKKHYIFFN